MKENTWKIDLKSALFLVIIITVCTLFLSITNNLYQGVIAERQKIIRMEILEDFGVSFSNDTFPSLFAENVETIIDRKSTYFIFKGTPQKAGIITSGSGLWGIIDLLIIINVDTKVIQKLRVLSHTETPGLGGKIEEEWFTSQFNDLDYSEDVKIVNNRTGATGEVDAISGATATSRSVETIINTAIQRYMDRNKR